MKVSKEDNYFSSVNKEIPYEGMLYTTRYIKSLLKPIIEVHYIIAIIIIIIFRKKKKKKKNVNKKFIRFFILNK